MIVNPRKGKTVQVWYKKALASEMPLHGKIGTVEVICKPHKAPRCNQVIEGVRQQGPRNHGVLIDGKVWVVPCGNIREVAA